MVVKKPCSYCKTEFVAKRISTRYFTDCNKKHYKELSGFSVIERGNIKEKRKYDFIINRMFLKHKNLNFKHLKIAFSITQLFKS